MKLAIALLFTLALVSCTERPEGDAALKEPLFDGLGVHSRIVTTSSELAQKYFDQGLAFLYAFNHDEAIRSFTQATELDSTCAMAYWGIAYANGPHINFPVVLPDKAEAAWNALENAKKYSSSGTDIEKGLIHALSARYANPQPENRAPLDSAFALAMERVFNKFASDADVGAIYAESMMNLRPWNYWTLEQTPQPGTEMILQTLDHVIKLAPSHPLALHLYVHAVEASGYPERSAAAADRLRHLQPGLGHMVHMPSHYDVRTGQWDSAIMANERAMKSDSMYQAKQPKQGFYRIYMGHNHHMLAFAGMMVGQSKKAVAAMDDFVRGVPADFIQNFGPIVDGFMIMPLEVRMRFGMWQEVLDAKMVDTIFPISTALQHYARGVSYGALKDLKKARAEQKMFRDAVKRVPADAAFGNKSGAVLLSIAEEVLEGELLIHEGKLMAGIEHLKKGVVLEDGTSYDEPRDWIQPVRHILGAAYLSANKPVEAEAVYRADLKRIPNNGWSLHGLTRALKMQNKNTDAEVTQKQFAECWKSADISISTSCLCLE
ncbi:MAG: hypothetical protein HQ472_04935 [Ignavibacteria bacterium]|nr:hypothetical protein [Ignavibacteria bacterium]